MVQAQSVTQTGGMFESAIDDLLAVTLVFLAAGAVKGVLGMGLPTLAMGLLGLLMPVAAAASLLTVPSLVTNLLQALAGRALRELARRLWPMQLGVVAGVALAPWLLPGDPELLGRRLLGGCLLAYGAVGLLGWRPRPPSAAAEPWLGPVVGVATGVVTGLTGVFVIPAVPYLQSLGLRKEVLTQALGISFTTSTLALAALLALQGHLGSQASGASVLMVVPAVAGMLLGQRLRDAMSETAFRRCFFAGLLALGGWLLWR